MSYDIERHIEELRAELNDCIDPRERKIIAAELADARAIRAAIDEHAFFADIDIEKQIGANNDHPIPF
ncbi:MAG: hypothetical protein WBO09_01850 [Methylocystis silviterrae]|uniref:hypothetical protein n=1 Tax=Methylocystis silviterrae TaxID=2743612 RepID=UPI003C74DA8B